MKTSIRFFPNTRKIGTKNKRIPIYLRLLHNGQKREKKLNVGLYENELPLWSDFHQRLSQKKHTVNDYLCSIEAEFNKWNNSSATNHSQWSIDRIFEIIVGGNNNKNDKRLLSYCNAFFENKMQESDDAQKKGTMRIYRNSLRKLNEFLVSKKMQSINYDEFNKDLAIEFKKFVEIDVESTTAATQVKKIIAIFNHLIEKELLLVNPFRNIKLSYDYKQREHLEIEEMNRLINLDLSRKINWEIQRDLFLFRCYTGLAHIDSNNLKPSNIFIEDDKVTLNTFRSKSKIAVKQILIEPAVAILLKYKDSIFVNDKNYVFPRTTLKNCNEILLKIAQLANINKPLTTHIGRHTFIQMLAEADITETKTIGSITGLSNKSAMKLNYTRTTNTLLNNSKVKLENYIKYER